VCSSDLSGYKVTGDVTVVARWKSTGGDTGVGTGDGETQTPGGDVAKTPAQKKAEKAAAKKANTPAKITTLKVKAGKKKAAVKWTPIAGVTGQQLAYKLKTAKKWKTVKLSAKAKSKAVRKLKKGKTYQFRIRSYKTVAGVKYYSAWSKTKKVRIK
jgi:pyruvate/2-oxoglutarate dehydrogenase complex dihydrolipoamide acyltransferase (E2) component